MYTEITMRAFCTSLMAMLVVVALFWGNCYSCPQMMLSSANHGCCHRTNAPKTECRSQSLRDFVKAEKAAPVPVLPVAAVIPAPLVVVATAVAEAAPRPVILSPTEAVPLRI